MSLLIIVCVVIVVIALVPSTQIFEGNLLVEQLSFTYVAPKENKKLFINSIRGIQQLEFSGFQTLTLTGEFISESNPKLNKLEAIEIQLPYSSSKLIVKPNDARITSKISLQELRLEPNTKVSQLSYNSSLNQLSFCLQIDDREDLCRLQDISPGDSTRGKPLGQLKLELPKQPLKVTLEGYRIPKLGLESSPEEKPLEFIFIPRKFYQQQWQLIPPASLYITLPKIDEGNSTRNQWFRGNINVKNVKFYRSDETGNIEDEIIISTILEGKLRMADKELDIQPNQFITAREPGIQRLLYLQIHQKRGLTVRVSGETQRLDVGIDRNFPVSSIRANLLARIGLSQDEIIALLSFCAALAGTLIPWLFEKLTDIKPDDIDSGKPTGDSGDNGNIGDQQSS